MAFDCEPATTTRSAPKFRRAKGTCKWCRGPKTEARSTAVFCSERCRKDYHNHVAVEGAKIVLIAKRWRRHRQKGDFALFTSLLDAMIRQDKEDERDFKPQIPAEAYAKVVGRNIQGRTRGRK